jgi:hypothetical protein
VVLSVTDREVVSCPHCQLKQFMTVSGSCRKCRGVLNAPKFEKPAPTLITPKLLCTPRPVPAPKPVKKHDRLVRRARLGALAEFKAAKTMAAKRAVIRWYLSNENAPYIPATV